MAKKWFYVLLIVCFFLVFPDLSAKEAPQKKEPFIAKDPSVSVTQHVIRINGKELRYTATAGYMVLKREDGKPRANVFYIAYTMDGVKDKSRRPVTFAFNGGPGSSSVWLHMGALGPKKVLMDDEGFSFPPPNRLEVNENTLLDVTDVVMIDPVSTGYSRAEQGVNPSEFHGLNEDVESVGEFIRLYITNNERWASPKFVLGESYGTTRAAGLSGYLQGRSLGMYLNGIILVSSVLDFQTISFMPGNDLPYMLFLPTYTATAWYHKKLPADLQNKALRDVLDEVEEFVLNEYALALLKGNEIPEGEKKEITEKLSRYTGLTPGYIERTNMRIDLFRFAKELLREEYFTVGRLDSRFKGKDADSAGENFESDPSSYAILGPFATTFKNYVRTELKYKSELPYNIYGNVRPWNWSVGRGRMPSLSVAETLRQAMRDNQFLKVFCANGYYDGATPYFATEYTFAHVGLNNEFKDRVRMGYYEAGHMMYIHKASHKKFKKDIAEFIHMMYIHKASHKKFKKDIAEFIQWASGK
jgi:carboxypeptidase C (cathepsin A)